MKKNNEEKEKEWEIINEEINNIVSPESRLIFDILYGTKKIVDDVLKSENKPKLKNLKGYCLADQQNLKEIDYWNKLDPASAAWLNKFLDEEYNGKFSNYFNLNHKKEQKRKIWRNKYKRQNDVMGSAYKFSDKNPSSEHNQIIKIKKKDKKK